MLFCFQRTKKYRCCGDDGNTAHRIPIYVHGEQVKGIVEDEHESQDESRPERQQSKRQAELRRSPDEQYHRENEHGDPDRGYHPAEQHPVDNVEAAQQEEYCCQQEARGYEVGEEFAVCFHAYFSFQVKI